VRPRGGALGTMRETNETLTHYLVLYMICVQGGHCCLLVWWLLLLLDVLVRTRIDVATMALFSILWCGGVWSCVVW